MHQILVTMCLLAAPTAPAAPADLPALRVCMLSGSGEYESDKTLPVFARRLEEEYGAACTVLKAEGVDRLPGLEALDSCDVALFFTRRLEVDGDALERVKRYCAAGKPIVAVRTASHGFQRWLAFDHEVLGGNYVGHLDQGTMEARPAADAGGHPVLDGVGTIRSRASLYRTKPLASDARVLLLGKKLAAPGAEATEEQPVAWVRERGGARIVYTSLGAQDDFEHAGFRRLLSNALFWAAGRKAERRPPPPLPAAPTAQGDLTLRLRSRVEAVKGSGSWREAGVEEKVPAARSAILICDLWDRHWCRGATERCDAIAARMAPVIDAAHARGVRVVHCPSETMDFYADWPARRRVLAVPAVAPPPPLPLTDPPLPIDDSDGGCDSGDPSWYTAWTRQNARVSIGPLDAISDRGEEVYSFLRSEGIDHLFVMGVHANMCVLGRSFAIRQMTRWGMRCVLVRDLTDAMYNPAMAPKVTHAAGTELVIEHIEKYWCPSMTAEDLLRALREGPAGAPAGR